MECFTRADIEVSDRARDLQHLLVWLSDHQLIKSLSMNLIINFQFLSDYVRLDHVIYGPVTDILKDKMVRKNPKHI